MSENYHYTMDREMFDSLKPISNHIIIRIVDDRKEHNGILLAKMTPVIPDKGLVVKISDDRVQKLITVGSKVIFERYMGKKIFVEDETYLVLHEDHIWVILPEDADVGIKYDGILK